MAAARYYSFGGAPGRKGFLHNMSLLVVTRTQCDEARQAAAAGKPTIAQRLTLAKGELMEGRIDSGKQALQQIIVDDPSNQSALVDDSLVLLGMVKNAASREVGPQQAYQDWAKVIRQYPTSDRGEDAVLYVGKMMREIGRQDKVDLINPLLKNYPEGVDVAGIHKVLD